jgi:hypothetical protein
MRDRVQPLRDADPGRAGAASLRTQVTAEPALIEAARELLAPVRSLLARQRSPLLTLCQARGDSAVRLFGWTERLEPGEEILAGGASAETVHAAIRAAGARALRQVALRWPPYAPPPAIGLVTDGTGLAISGEHPCGLSRQWLIDQLGQGAPASIILPFDESGVWALLSRTPAGPSCRDRH